MNDLFDQLWISMEKMGLNEKARVVVITGFMFKLGQRMNAILQITETDSVEVIKAKFARAVEVLTPAEQQKFNDYASDFQARLLEKLQTKQTPTK